MPSDPVPAGHRAAPAPTPISEEPEEPPERRAARPRRAPPRSGGAPPPGRSLSAASTRPRG